MKQVYCSKQDDWSVRSGATEPGHDAADRFPVQGQKILVTSCKITSLQLKWKNKSLISSRWPAGADGGCNVI